MTHTHTHTKKKKENSSKRFTVLKISLDNAWHGPDKIGSIV